MPDKSSSDDTSVIYIVLILCGIAIFAYFIYSLYIKLNELFEKVEGIKNDIDSGVPHFKPTPLIEEIPELPKEIHKEIPELSEELPEELHEELHELPELPELPKLVPIHEED